MNHDAVKRQEISIPCRIAPYLILALMLAASFWLWRFWANAEETTARQHFDAHCEGTSQTIANRMYSYKIILHGSAGIFIASEEVNREGWRAYCEYSQISTLIAGIQGLSFVKVVAPSELARHVESIRAEGFPEYRVRPGGERPLYAPVIFIEPLDARNLQALGYDPFSDPVRREAMERARDTATAALSSRVRLVHETDEDLQAGFLIFVPVYDRDMPQTDVEERRAALTGYVCAVLRVKDFMRSIFAEAPLEVAFELYDGATVSPEALLFASSEMDGGPGKEHRARFSSHTTLELFGHTWGLAFRSTPEFEAAETGATYLPKIVLIAGLVISIVVFLLMLSQLNVATKSAALAEALAVNLRDSKRAGEAIKAQERLLATILQTTVDGFWLVDMQKRINQVNDAYCAMSGYSREELLSLTVNDLDAVEISEKTSERMKRIVENGSELYETWHRRKDGTIFPLEISVTYLPEHGRRLVCFCRDITERKCAEEALRASENANALKAELLMNAPVIAAFHDRDQNIVWVNKAYEEATGLSLQDIVGKKCYNVWNLPEPCQDCPVLTAIATGKASEAELTPQNQKHWPESQGYWLSKASPVRDKEGTIIGAIEVAINITKLKQVERSLREANQALEAASARANELATHAELATQSKSAFLANMSHEIRTPLTAVLGFAQILERDASLTPRQTEMLHAIARSGRHLQDLINDILDMSKIEAGKLELNPADFCLHDLLDDLKTMFLSRAQAKQLQLLIERDDSVPRYVNADKGKLRQVLINLMSNAIKFTDTGGGSVRVRADAEPGDSGGPPSALRLVMEVEDSGPGIAEDELAHIFEPFRQLSAGRKAGGTGLGLAVSWHLVALMGGRLTVKSQVGKGSCFRFDALVKLADGAPQEQALKIRQVVGLEQGTGPFRILVADDQQDNRDLLVALLEPLNFEIREAVNGQEALDFFEAWSPHAVFMDMRMPTMDGYEAAWRVKATEQGRATPVIAVTASAFEDAKREILATGVDAYVRKPYRPEEIFAVLGKCLGLRYVYAEGTAQTSEQADGAGDQPLTREDLAALPDALRQAMRQVVEEGDMAALQALIAQVEEKNTEAARKLRNRADQYDYETLIQVLAIRSEGVSDE